jgi:hypothetical protein
VYTPKLTNVFDNDIITEIVDYSKNPADDLMHFFDERVIIQYAGLWDGIPGQKADEEPFSHAACLVKYDGELFLLDCAEAGAINLSRDPEISRSLLHTLGYINMFEMKKLTPEASVVQALGTVFDRIYSGEPSRIRGGNKRLPGKSSNKVNKSDRAKSAVGERIYRGK